ncbi:VOC family protein [Hirschia litorea]|uniref:VOC family protein n=1 Tax=Hirschia litorea TaxID=1199156 RepID=A0ABW2IKP8_9PROT
MQLNQVTLPLTDFDASVAFYKTLGLRLIVSAPPRYARFECVPESGQGEPATFSIAANGGSPAQGAYPACYFETPRVDEIVSRLKAAGYVVFSEAEDKTYGWREAVVQDPAGNKIRIYWGGKNRRFPEWRID